MSSPAAEDRRPDLPSPWFGLPLSRRWRHDPLATAADIQREHGDVVRGRILFRDFVWVFDPAIARQVLLDRDGDFVKDARQLAVFQDIQGRNVLTVDGSDWERQRRILTPVFAARRMAGYIALMAAATGDVFRELLPARPGESVEIDAEVFGTRLTLDVISRALFSETVSAEASRRASQAIAVATRQGQRELFWPWTPPDWMPYPGRRPKLAAARLLNAWVAERIEGRTRALRGDGGGDMLDALLAARDDGEGGRGLTRAEVHDNCLAIFLAGHETSAKALAWWMGLMAHHPRVAAEVQREVDALPEVVHGDPATVGRALTGAPWLTASLQEALRLYPPIIAAFMRTARRDVTLGEHRVRFGTGVSVMTVALQRDPRWFPEPGTFRPERFLPGAPDVPRGAFLPFGAGGHVCIGQHFAMVELALIGAALLRRFRISPGPDEALPEPRVDIVLRPARPLRVRVERRHEGA